MTTLDRYALPLYALALVALIGLVWEISQAFESIVGACYVCCVLGMTVGAILARAR